MNTCQSCGCNPCACPGPTALNNARLINPNITGGTWTGGIINGATLNGGTSNGQQITGATIDCTTLVCTQPPGTCDATVASTGFVCQAVADAISGANAAFCNAVAICLGGGAACGIVASCINTTPGIIQNPAAFDPLTFATTAQSGPIRVATLAEVQGASCLLAIDPCTLGAFWSAGGPNALWTAFTAAVNSVLAGTFCAQVDACITTSATLCAAVAACGFAPLANPVLTGNPQAPTPAPGDSDASIATTAFVQAELAAQISGLNPAFCAAVSACGGAVGAGNFASFTVPVSSLGGPAVPSGPAVANYGCVALGGPGGITVSFTNPQPDMNYIANMSMRGTSGAFPSIFTSEHGIPGSGGAGIEVASIGGSATVLGVADMNISSPMVAGGLPYTGFVTVVFSR